MEREIKFEYGFESVNGIVKKVYFLHEVPDINNKCDVWNVLPIKYVRQFTGLRDKNGKEIYEGDVVKLVSNHIADLTSDPKYITTTICKVWFDKGMFKFNDMTMDYGGLYRGELEVIGSIHENPELLTKQ